jgi:hypothetical protein
MRWDIVDRVGKRFAVMSPRRLAVAYRTTYTHITLQYTHDATLHCVLRTFRGQKFSSKKTKTYNSGYSPVVTHLTTNPPVHCLSTAEQTGSSIFSVLWSYVKDVSNYTINNLMKTFVHSGIFQPKLTAPIPLFCITLSFCIRVHFLRGLSRTHHSIINITTYENLKRDRLSNRSINVYTQEKGRY